MVVRNGCSLTRSESLASRPPFFTGLCAARQPLPVATPVSEPALKSIQAALQVSTRCGADPESPLQLAIVLVQGTCAQAQRRSHDLPDCPSSVHYDSDEHSRGMRNLTAGRLKQNSCFLTFFLVATLQWFSSFSFLL